MKKAANPNDLRRPSFAPMKPLTTISVVMEIVREICNAPPAPMPPSNNGKPRAVAICISATGTITELDAYAKNVMNAE